MAAVSTLQYQRRKKLVYGKQGSTSKFNTTHVDEFFRDDELPAPKSSKERQVNVKAAYPVQKTETKAHALKPVRPTAKRQDTFDVPSSDEEISWETKIVSAPEFKTKPALVDDTDTTSTQLTSWEKRKLDNSLQDHAGAAKKSRTAAVSPEAQLKRELARAVAVSPKSPGTASSPKGKSNVRQNASATTSPSRKTDQETLSAAARLAARRTLEDRATPKRSILSTDDLESTPRKRVRTATGSREASAEVHMPDAFSAPICELPQDEGKVTNRDSDIYNFPESSADESVNSKPVVEKPKMAKKPARRGNLATYSSRSTPRKGVSAPARLAEMIPTDTDTTDPPTRSPSSMSTRSTPHQPSTPPSAHMASPETAIKAAGTLTPKQAQLWKRLLPSDPVAPSPSALPIKDLTISGKRRTGAAPLLRKLAKSQSDVTRRRTRLVDRLKASAPSSDDELSDEDEEDAEISDVVEQANAAAPEAVEEVKKAPAPKSQSQSQTSATGSGPKITYSRMRSYLPEDNLEDDLMAGLATETLQQATQAGRIGKSQMTSQKSAFDFDNSDNEESGTSKIRTIHELRASGRNIRGMEDILELLDEVANHNISHRSRRRSALVELATKLADKSFAARFVGQSFELQLAVECGASPDEIADFVLAAAVALIVVSEPPEHAVRSLQDQGVVAWLAQRLERDAEISKLAKDRRNNMSKASQGSLVEFAEMLKQQPSLWEEEKPTTITPRLIALKALDQLVSRLRRLGNKTELLSEEQVLLVLPAADLPVEPSKQMDTALSISVLESLSTTHLSLTWPSNTLERIAELLPQLNATSPMLRHTMFLTLRLCLNLTNDNSRNCRLITASSSTVTYLLQVVKQRFDSLDSEQDEEKRAIALDLLVLAMGIMINLAENCDAAGKHAVGDQELLSALVDVFQNGQKRMLEAESVEESISNVAFGYLAVMLANLCQYQEPKTFIASKLPGKNLSMLVEAVEEFVLHHQKVDMMNFGGEEGMDIWSAFTEKLKAVLARLKELEQVG